MKIARFTSSTRSHQDALERILTNQFEVPVGEKKWAPGKLDNEPIAFLCSHRDGMLVSKGCTGTYTMIIVKKCTGERDALLSTRPLDVEVDYLEDGIPYAVREELEDGTGVTPTESEEGDESGHESDLIVMRNVIDWILREGGELPDISMASDDNLGRLQAALEKTIQESGENLPECMLDLLAHVIKSRGGKDAL